MNSRSRVPLLQSAVFSLDELFVADEHFPCPEVLLPVGVLLSYSLFLCQDARC
jgi:hypothetical protein